MNYYNVQGKSDMPFQIIIGGRGIGKTYSALEEVHNNYTATEEKFLLLRCTEKELQNIGSEIGNPFKSLNNDKNWNVDVKTKSKDSIGAFRENEKIIGYCSALSTFANMRGIDLSDVTTTVFDEFARESHLFQFKGMGKAFLHFYETVNRNRELKGKNPMKVYLLANSVSLKNDILIELNCVQTIVNMLMRGHCKYTDKQRGLYIEIVNANNDISLAKSTTALYRLTKGSDFEKESLKNMFVNDDLSRCGKKNIAEYIPTIKYGNVLICRHKTRDEYYITRSNLKCKISLMESQLEKFRLIFKPTFNLYDSMDLIFYEDYALNVLINALLK